MEEQHRNAISSMLVQQAKLLDTKEQLFSFHFLTWCPLFLGLRQNYCFTKMTRHNPLFFDGHWRKKGNRSPLLCRGGQQLSFHVPRRSWRGLFGLKKFPFIILHGGLLDTILEQIDRVLKVNSLLAAGERRWKWWTRPMPRGASLLALLILSHRFFQNQKCCSNFKVYKWPKGPQMMILS